METALYKLSVVRSGYRILIRATYTQICLGRNAHDLNKGESGGGGKGQGG